MNPCSRSIRENFNQLAKQYVAAEVKPQRPPNEQGRDVHKNNLRKHDAVARINRVTDRVNKKNQCPFVVEEVFVGNCALKPRFAYQLKDCRVASAERISKTRRVREQVYEYEARQNQRAVQQNRLARKIFQAVKFQTNVPHA